MLGSQLPLFRDSFPIISVAHVAALIADRCITEENGYAGGWARAGPRRGLVVVGYLTRDADSKNEDVTLGGKYMEGSVDT